MSRLDDYRNALLAAFPEVSGDKLDAVLDVKGDPFAGFVIDHGLGPLWHERTGHDAFHESRMLAEALFLAQEKALLDIGGALDGAGIDHVAIKGAANRLLAYANPAARACHDLDILVRPGDRASAARVLVDLGYTAAPKAPNISRELELMRGNVQIDLHWALLREGRLRRDPTSAMLDRRRNVQGVWMLSPEDALFVLLVHPAFAKHLAGWNMGLHRIVDLLAWLRDVECDWPAVRGMLQMNGVCAAAWATLRWAALLAGEAAPRRLHEMLIELRPGPLRHMWLDYWLKNNVPQRTSKLRVARLLGFSAFLHDAPGDVLRAARGRRSASRRVTADLAVFEGLVRE